MSKIELINGSCADQKVDAVVNAANRDLQFGGGICYVIFTRSGINEMTAACSKYDTPLKDGSVVITPSFKMTNCKYIIHAVGPDFRNTPNAFKELYEAYYNSLKVLVDNNLNSISFPLISSSIFGAGYYESCKQCLRAYNKFIKDYPYKNLDVKLCAYTSEEYADCLKQFNS